MKAPMWGLRLGNVVHCVLIYRFCINESEASDHSSCSMHAITTAPQKHIIIDAQSEFVRPVGRYVSYYTRMHTHTLLHHCVLLRVHGSHLWMSWD